MGQQTQLDDVDDGPTGRWMVMPDATEAAAHATPFPDFDEDVYVGATVHDITVSQMVRIAEQERAR